MVAPLARGARFRRRDRHPLRGARGPLHRSASRAASCGAPASWRPSGAGPPPRARTSRTPTPTATASTTCRSSWESATPTRSTPTHGSTRWPSPAAGPSSTGTARPASPRSSASSRTTCCASSSAGRPSPTPASTSKASRSIPSSGGVILVANHRSYFDVFTLALVAAELNRPVRFLAKRELFDVAPFGWLLRAIGGISVDRGSGSGEPLRAGRRRRCVPARPWSSSPRAPSLEARRRSTRCCAATPAWPGSPLPPARR